MHSRTRWPLRAGDVLFTLHPLCLLPSRELLPTPASLARLSSCRSSSGGGPVCRALPTARIFIKLHESSSGAHVCHVRRGACAAQPGWGR